MKQRKLNQLRRTHLLAIIAGCNRLECFPTIAMLVDALNGSRDKRSSRDPLYRSPVKSSPAVGERLVADLSVLQQQHWVKLNEGSYYQLSGDGQNVATTIAAPIYAFCAARAELIAEIARLDQNDECDVLFLDRFELSTYAYQMAPLLALGMDFDTAYDRVNAIAGSLHTGRPDILIFCDSIAEVGLERATSASDEPDQFEKQGVSYQNALLERYRILFKTGRFGHISIRVQPYPNLLSHELVDIYLLQVLELVHKYMETSPKPKTRLLVRED